MPVHITFESHSVSRNGRWFMRRMYCICCCWCWSMIMIFYTLDTNFKIHNAIAQTYLNSLIKPYKQNWSREHDEHEIIHKGQHSWILVRFYSNRVCQRDNHSWCVKQCSVILTLIAMFKVEFSSRFMPTHFPSKSSFLFLSSVLSKNKLHFLTYVFFPSLVMHISLLFINCSCAFSRTASAHSRRTRSDRIFELSRFSIRSVSRRFMHFFLFDALFQWGTSFSLHIIFIVVIQNRMQSFLKEQLSVFFFSKRRAKLKSNVSIEFKWNNHKVCDSPSTFFFFTFMFFFSFFNISFQS